MLGGLHFPSDAVASERICDAVFPLLTGCAAFTRTLAAAKTEWSGLTAYPTPWTPPPQPGG